MEIAIKTLRIIYLDNVNIYILDSTRNPHFALRFFLSPLPIFNKFMLKLLKENSK